MKKIISVVLCFLVVVSMSACFKDTPAIEMPAEDETEVIGEIVDLYFPDENVFALTVEERVIEYVQNFEKAVVEEVIKGPVDKKLNKAIYGDVKVLNVKTENGLCTVDLSKEFASFNAGGSTQELMAIYSIVNSLCALTTVDKVKINLEGLTDWDFGGHFYMGDVLEFDENIVG